MMDRMIMMIRMIKMISCNHEEHIVLEVHRYIYIYIYMYILRVPSIFHIVIHTYIQNATYVCILKYWDHIVICRNRER